MGVGGVFFFFPSLAAIIFMATGCCVEGLKECREEELMDGAFEHKWSKSSKPAGIAI